MRFEVDQWESCLEKGGNSNWNSNIYATVVTSRALLGGITREKWLYIFHTCVAFYYEVKRVNCCASNFREIFSYSGIFYLFFKRIVDSRLQLGEATVVPLVPAYERVVFAT